MKWRCLRWHRGLPGFAIVAAIAILATLYYRATALSGLIPIGYDVFTYFYPNETFAAEALRQARLPLWNPYLFTGVPFLANSQTGVLYPPNLLFLIGSVPRAYVYSVLLHVTIAGCSAYAFSRWTLGVDRLSAMAAACVFAFGGFAGSLFGHLNQLQVVAWTPLVLTAFERSYRRRSVGWALLAGLTVGLQALAGHSQELYLTLIVLGLFFVLLFTQSLFELHGGGRGSPAQSPSVLSVAAHRASAPARQLARQIVLPVAVVAVGFGIAAAQLVPTAELSVLSLRSGGLPFDDAASFSLPPWLMLKALLPTFGEQPIFSEWLGYVGVTGLLLAALAVARRPRDHRVIFFTALAVLSVVMALGAATPVFHVAYKLVPGISLFRVPARWLFPYTLAIASLAALGLNSIRLSDPRPKPTSAPADSQQPDHRGSASRWREFGTMATYPLLIVALASPFVAYRALNVQPPLELPGTPTIAIWGGVGALTLGLIAASYRPGLRHVAAAGIAAVLVAELFAAGLGLELNRPNVPDAFTSLRQSAAHFWADPGLYRILAAADNTYDPGDLHEMQSMLGQVLQPEQVYDYVVAAKLKETMAPNLPLLYKIPTLDGYDGGALPLKRYVEFKALFPLPGEAQSDGRFREQLDTVPPSPLLSWLNVKYFLMDRVNDIWVDGVYYDLGIIRQLLPDDQIVLNRIKPFATTSLGVISYITGGSDISQGTEVATVEVADASGDVFQAVLRAGIDTAEGSCCEGTEGSPVAHHQPRAVGQSRSAPSANLYLAKITLPYLTYPKEITIRSSVSAGQLNVQSLSLIDDRLGISQTVPIDNSLRIAHLGDVKIYENVDVAARAFLVDRVKLAKDDDEALALLKCNGIDPLREAVVLATEWPFTRSQDTTALLETTADGASSSAATIVRYEPERVEIDASADRRSLLVLTDSYYPGWRVVVDGQEQPIVRTDYLFRGVVIEPGRHRVEFTFEPLSVKLGLAISLATVGLIVLVLAAALLQGRRRV